MQLQTFLCADQEIHAIAFSCLGFIHAAMLLCLP
jgi:hypothetical protein